MIENPGKGPDFVVRVVVGLVVRVADGVVGVVGGVGGSIMYRISVIEPMMSASASKVEFMVLVSIPRTERLALIQ